MGMEIMCGRMVASTKATTDSTKNMEMVRTPTQMAASIEVSGTTVCSMVWGGSLMLSALQSGRACGQTVSSRSGSRTRMVKSRSSDQNITYAIIRYVRNKSNNIFSPL